MADLLSGYDVGVLVLFSTTPTDRALAGWEGAPWVAHVLEALRTADKAAAAREAA